MRVPALVLNQITAIQQATNQPLWLAVEKALDSYILSLPSVKDGESDLYLIDQQRQIREKRLMMERRIINGTQRARGSYYKLKAQGAKLEYLEVFRQHENDHIAWLEAKEKELFGK